MRAILAAMLAVTAQLAAHADDAVLAKLVGEWTGRGTMQLKPDAAPERVYCKITNTISPDGKTLDQKGRCSLASSSGRVDGEIVLSGDGKYTGTLASLASRGPAALTGTGSASRVVLDASFVDALTGNPDTSVNTIEVFADGYRLTTVRKNPQTGEAYTSSTIAFTAN
ncbi:MAG TPA: hypothetical protein VHA70_12565 [Bauldia sp.]|nr:hypothetical protein [Bauldia sp.]